MREINKQIHIAAEELLMEGQWPTVSTVREKLGTGSNTTINNELKLWRNAFLENLRKSKHRPSCPEVLTHATDKIWGIACEEAERIFNKEKNEMVEKEESIKKHLEKMEEEINELNFLTKKNESRIKELEEQNNILIFELKNEKEKTQKKHEQIKTLEMEINKEKLRTDDVIKFYKNQLHETKQEEILKIEKLKLELQQREDVAYKRLEGIRFHIYGQIESERNNFLEERSNLEKIISKLEKQNEDLTKEINKLIYRKGVLEAENSALKKEFLKKSKFILNRNKK